MRLKLIFAILCVTCLAEQAFAWGAGTHVKLATDLVSQAGLLSAAIASLLSRHFKDFLYGNIAADVVVGKRLSRVRYVCHRWQTALRMLDDARDEPAKAFAYGYLAHLAADAIAHNKFVPRQLILTRTSGNLGHVFWELRSDAFVDVACWNRLEGTLIRPFEKHQALLARHISDTLLPFEVNLRLFNRMHLIACASKWRRLVVRWNASSKWRLEPDLLAAYHRESLRVMALALNDPTGASATLQDPAGVAVLKQVRKDRRLLRRLSWRGLRRDWLAMQMASAYEPEALPTEPLGRLSVA